MYRFSWNFAGWCSMVLHLANDRLLKIHIRSESKMPDSGSKCDCLSYRSTTLNSEPPLFRNRVRYLNHFWSWCVAMTRQCPYKIWCTPFLKTYVCIMAPPKNRRKSYSKSSITQPFIDRSRSYLIHSVTSWYPIYHNVQGQEVNDHGHGVT